ncbi:MAG: S41 family peptidase [Gemmatales bacterium]
MVRVGLLPGILSLLALLVLLAQPMAQDQKNTKPRPPQDSRLKAVTARTAEEYAVVVSPLIKTISKDYHFEAISETALAGRALLGLYRAGSIVPPDALVREPDQYFNSIAGEKLIDKLKVAREAVGDMPLIQGERGIHAAMHSAFRSLDIFSNYSEVDSTTRAIYESGVGIGLFLEDKPLGGSYFVRNVTIDSPAHKQGLRPGDELLEIGKNHQPISPNTPTAQVNATMTIMARQREGLTLTIRNLQGIKKTIEVTTPRQTIDNSELVIIGSEFDRDTMTLGYRPTGEGEWDYWVDYPHRIALIRLGTIQTPPNRIMEIVHLLKEDGLKGLILDLRDCPSGVPEYSADLAGFFLNSDVLIAKTNHRNNETDDNNRVEQRREYRSNKEMKHCLDLPLTVLIGPDTSGAAELIAAALQDHKRATIVGQRSRGKSTIQNSSRELNNPYGVRFSYRLTVGVFMRPSGKNLHRMPGATAKDDWGVRPDVEVVLPNQMRRQIRAWWFEHDIRPADSLEPTKMDDIRNDPVMAAAVKVLSK